MSDTSAHLALPFIFPGQAQKHVTLNEVIGLLDALIQCHLIDTERTEPPTSPNNGDRHLVASGSTGSWVGKDHHIAVLIDGAWAFLAPKTGWQVTSEQDDLLRTYDGTSWEPATLQLGKAGINTPADESNRLAVSSDGSLFTHAGSGHQLKLNKAAASDTASLLWQTGFEGRAEIGLTGDDNLHIKIADLSDTWLDALVLDRAKGWVGLNEASPAQPLHIAGGNPCVRLQESADGYLDLMNTQATQSTIRHTALDGQALIDISPEPLDGTSHAMFRFFRSTNTTGSARLDIHVGNGTFETNCRLAGNGSGFVNALHGDFGVGTDAPQVTLDVNGPVRVGSYSAAALPATVPPAQIIYISDETGGPTLAYSDGSDWRRITDGAVVS